MASPFRIPILMARVLVAWGPRVALASEVKTERLAQMVSQVQVLKLLRLVRYLLLAIRVLQGRLAGRGHRGRAEVVEAVQKGRLLAAERAVAAAVLEGAVALAGLVAWRVARALL